MKVAHIVTDLLQAITNYTKTLCVLYSEHQPTNTADSTQHYVCLKFQHLVGGGQYEYWSGGRGHSTPRINACNNRKGYFRTVNRYVISVPMIFNRSISLRIISSQFSSDNFCTTLLLSTSKANNYRTTVNFEL